MYKVSDRVYLYLFLFLFTLKGYADAPLTPKIIPRTIIGIYDGREDIEVRYLNLHELLEMPLNHLGLCLEFYDVKKKLPDIANREDVLGVISWCITDIKTSNADHYIKWLTGIIQAGKKLVFVGDAGFRVLNEDLLFEQSKGFWSRYGLIPIRKTIFEIFDAEITDNSPELTSFERAYSGILPSYTVMRLLDSHWKIHVGIQLKGRPETFSPVIATGPQGGYIACNYGVYKHLANREGPNIRKWYINPFLFFQLAFGLDLRPIPDTTTLAGRRLFYSQIDGDGWNNLTELEPYREEKMTCADVIYHEILLKNADLPVTVAPIAADIDANWEGLSRSREIAKKIFQLSHIEIGCHTFTHPFDWAFFKNYKPEDEIPYLSKYPGGSWEKKGMLTRFFDRILGNEVVHGLDTDVILLEDEGPFEYPLEKLQRGYSLPRAYALKPFNIELEVIGAINETNSLAPKGKKVEIYQWSGNCLPFSEAIALTKKAGVQNINGGDTRFDFTYNSYAWVRPLGRNVKGQQQIYASNSNENTYTGMWTSRFYGFNQLVQTFCNTEVPIRIKPMNLYYHAYSGEKLASLDAIRQNIEYIRRQKYIPVQTSHFAKIANGFYQARLLSLAPKKWKIENRGDLQTLRFDRAVFETVDFSQSEGVVGQRHLQGSLYVYLDKNHEIPVLALKETEIFYEEPAADSPYLVESQWLVWDFKKLDDDHYTASTQGYGKGDMVWRIPSKSRWKVVLKGPDQTIYETDYFQDFLRMEWPSIGIDPLILEIEREDGS